MRSANCRINCWRIIECGACESNIRISKIKNGRVCTVTSASSLHDRAWMQKSPVTRMVIENVRRIIPSFSMANPRRRCSRYVAKSRSTYSTASVGRKSLWRSSIEHDEAFARFRLPRRKIVTIGLRDRLNSSDDVTVKHVMFLLSFSIRIRHYKWYSLFFSFLCYF